jgi:hypothetical protein
VRMVSAAVPISRFVSRLPASEGLHAATRMLGGFGDRPGRRTC